jgi:hypothetical protein
MPMPTLDDVQLEVVSQHEKISQHTTEIAELRQMQRETLESMRAFGEKVARLIAIQETTHTPETCSAAGTARKEIDEIFIRLRAVEAEAVRHEAQTAQLAAMNTTLAAIQTDMTGLKNYKVATDTTAKIVGWFFNGGLERILQLAGLAWLIVHFAYASAAPAVGH